MAPTIPFNLPFRAPNERRYVERALAAPARQGNGAFTAACTDLIKAWLGDRPIHLTPSCTAALELAALVGDFAPGDEVIMPSYTFVSAANAFVLRGATPVFVDVDPSTLNIDPAAAAAAVSERTRAIVVVHYAGIACDMAAFQALAKQAEALLIEDAAQAYGAYWTDRPLGSVGDMAVFSFHDTKNISSGEGGALVINNPDFARRAEILWEKGTNRTAFLKGDVDKYTWIDVGSSFLPSEITAAMLRAHLEAAGEITRRRREIWSRYDDRLSAVIPGSFTGVSTPRCPEWAVHNGHLYYLIFRNTALRDRFRAAMDKAGISAPFHYVPLHSSPAGTRYGRVSGTMANTERAGNGLVRLPLFANLELDTADRIVETVIWSLEAIGLGWD